VLHAPFEGVVALLVLQTDREVGVEDGLEGDPLGPGLGQRRAQRPPYDGPLAEGHRIHGPHGIDVLGDPDRHTGGA
jgi:hypothetical protein